MTRRRRLAPGTLTASMAVVVLGVTAAPASADLVFFTSGRVLSVEAHRVDGDSLVLTLRGGGVVVCSQSLVASIKPDEVPHPDPAALAAVAADAGEAESGDADLAGPGEERLQAIQRLDPLIDRISARNEVDGTLVRAVIQVESGYRERARSPKGAMGLMQLMPATARQYRARDPYDPMTNIDAGTRHLKSLLDRFPLALALAAYNAGEAAVLRYGGIPPYPETRAYVARVLALAAR
jgi:hypothetical protein